MNTEASPAVPAKLQKKIVSNPIKDGVLLCPICFKGAVWPENGRFMTSPMQRFIIKDVIDALVHRCCAKKLFEMAQRTIEAERMKNAEHD